MPKLVPLSKIFFKKSESGYSTRLRMRTGIPMRITGIWAWESNGTLLISDSTRIWGDGGKTGEICSDCRTLIQFGTNLFYLRFGEERSTHRHFRKVFSLTLELLRVMSRNCREWSYRSRTRSAQLCLSLERLNQLNCSFQNRITDIARPNFHFSKEKMNRKVRVRKRQQTITRY